MKNIYLQIIDHQLDKLSLVLATVTRSSGSTPVKPGSSALFSRDGLLSGTVGGGIVEGKIQKIAIEAAGSEKSGHFHFNLAYDISRTDEAICGGETSVLVDSSLNNSLTVFEQVNDSISKHIPGVLITSVGNRDGVDIIISRYWMSDSVRPLISDVLLENIEPLVKELLSSGGKPDYRELEFSEPGEEYSYSYFLEPIFPPDQLVIAGAGHIGRALAHIGRLLDFEVTVIDNRPEYANIENIPDADHIIVKDIGEAMQLVKKHERSYIVIVTRGHKDDAEALKPCVRSSAAYIGMIGSTKKVSKMRTSFIDKGWATESEWNRLYAPVGLDIKSQRVEEIAVSIAAQLVLVRNSQK